MAKSLEGIEEDFEELELKLTAQFESLKEFTFKKMKENEKKVNALEERFQELELNFSSVDLKEEINKLDDSLGSLRGEFENFKSTTPEPSVMESSPCEDKRKHKSPATENTQAFKKPFRGFSFKSLKSFEARSSLSASSWPATLDDIKNDSLRQSLGKYYRGSSVSTASKLNAVQEAYFNYYMTDVVNGCTARRTVIEELIPAGVKHGMWPEKYTPDGIKNSFADYLREKAKNSKKKKLADSYEILQI